MEGMHLTPIGHGNVLLEPKEGLDPSNPDAYLPKLMAFLQKAKAQRLLYDLTSLPLVDSVYYEWLKDVHRLCQIAGVKLIAVSMRPTAAYALAIASKEPPPFACARDVDRVS